MPNSPIAKPPVDPVSVTVISLTETIALLP
jgi:hypothetical protein